MAVKINRHTGWIGMGSRFQILINGKKQDTLAYNSEVYLKIPNEEAIIQATQWGIKTNKISVRDGDELELITTGLGKSSTLLAIALPLILQWIPNIVFTYLLVAIALIAYLIYFYKVEGAFYKLVSNDTMSSNVTNQDQRTENN